MAIKVRSRWRLAALTAGLVLLAITVPAQAADPIITFVGGDTNCSSSVVNTSAESSMTLSSFSNSPQAGVDGAVITLSRVGGDNFRTKFSFTITGGVVFDVIVKGSGANWYHYEGGTLGGTDTLVIPNGNKLNVVHFCYTAGTPLACGGEVTTEADPNASGTFTRDSDNCSGFKLVDIRILDNNTVLFVPSGGSGSSQFTGTVVFTKNSGDDGAFVLKYDKFGDGVEFFIVPDCAAGLPNTVHTWCVVSAEADYNLGSEWTITWNVKGIGDPRFK